MVLGASSDLMAVGARDVGRAVAFPATSRWAGSTTLGRRAPRATIRQPRTRISQELVRLLLALLAGGSGVGIILPTTLAVWESA